MRGQTDEPLKKIFTVLIVLVVVGLGIFALKSFFIDGPGGLFRLLPTNYTSSTTDSHVGDVLYRVDDGRVLYWENGWKLLSRTVKVGSVMLDENEVKRVVEERYFVRPNTYRDLTPSYRLFVQEVFATRLAYDTSWFQKSTITWERGDIFAQVVDGTVQQSAVYVLRAKTGKADFRSFDTSPSAFQDTPTLKALAQERLLDVRRSLFASPIVYSGLSYCPELYTAQQGLEIVFNVGKPLTGEVLCNIKG